MSEENEPKEIEPKGSRILFCYFVVVLLLGLARTWQYLFVGRQVDGYQRASLLYVYRL